MRPFVLACVLVAIAACGRAKAPVDDADKAALVDAATQHGFDAGADASATPNASASDLPPREDRCARDEDCAVAQVETSGRYACCGSCGTTPGTRSWVGALREACFKRPAAVCPPLACPMGPTRAVCRDGHCAATPYATDGGAAFVAYERRCLPSTACNGWLGCALVSGNAQDGWLAEQHERADVVGKVVGVEQVCFDADGGRRCVPAAIAPLVCVATPSKLVPVPFKCEMAGNTCRIAR